MLIREKLRDTNLGLAIILSAWSVLYLSASVFAQDFNLIFDPGNPIVSDVTTGNYTGSAWVDYDNDGDIDLFVVNGTVRNLYRNDGGGTFVKITTGPLLTDATVGARSCTWGDYDNDGDIDCYLGGNPSALFANDGSGNFTKVTTGDIATFDNRGWSAGWADYDNDGNLDLALSHPAGFVGNPSTPNHMYRNDGPPSYTFDKLDTGIIVTGLAPYTDGAWWDYDDDGDIDYFMASGPANGTGAPDFIYQNQLAETGLPGFLRLTDAPLGTDLQDGQNWALIDYDNDGDLDAYITNWSSPTLTFRKNRLYRNDGGSFVEITSGDIVNDADVSLGTVWEDFDNDGDLDCFVANDNAFPSRYYLNDGDGTFTKVTTGAIATQTGPNTGVSAGDYDNDGDIDLFVCGQGAGNRLLFENVYNNGNHWAKFKLTGVYSNKSAIGAIVKVKATINGSPTWMRRTVSASNSFMGHSSLIMHFGLGDATTIDSAIVLWPSGHVQILEGLSGDTQHDITESGVGFNVGSRFGPVGHTVNFVGLTGETPMSWDWDFGDSESSSDPSPMHTYNTAGLHDVSVMITTASESFSYSRNNYVAIHADSLIPQSAEGTVGGQVAVDVYMRNFLPVGVVQIPLVWSGSLSMTLSDAQVTGLRSSAMTLSTVTFDPFGQTAVYKLTAPASTPLLAGNGAVLRLIFDIDAGTSADTGTVTIMPISGMDLTVNSAYGAYLATGGAGQVSVSCCDTPGDADDNSSVNIADATFLIARIFSGGSAPVCQDQADADGSNAVNIADVTYLIARIFAGGPAPICGTTGT